MKTKKEQKEYQKQYRARQKLNKNKTIPKTKVCISCKEEKSGSEFHKANGDPTGLTNMCKTCKKSYNKSIKDKLYESNRAFCKKLKSRTEDEIEYPKTKSCYKCKSVKNKDEFYKCRSRKTGLSDACKKCTLEYRAANKDQRKEYVKERRRNDPEYKMYCSLQKRLHGALKLRGIRKANRTMELIGCTPTEFVKHIESLWVKGMSWDNYGKKDECWCLDHIRPCASFNLLDEKEQKECFYYKNIQPLWNADNFSKSSWYNGIKYTAKS